MLQAGKGSTNFSKEIIMTIVDDTSTRSAAPAAIRKAIGYFTTGLARLINCWIAALIAHREYQANLALLQSLSHRQLRDIGLDRCRIGEGLAELANDRSRSQQSTRTD